MIKLKIEPTSKDEQETFINIDEYDKKVTITTHTQRVFNRLFKKLGTPHQTFKPVNKLLNQNEYISGASWTYNFFDNRDEIKKILSITNLISKKKDTTDNIFS